MTVKQDDDSEAECQDRSPPRQDKHKPGKLQQYLDIPLQTSFRPSTDDSGSLYSAENENERQRGRLFAPAALRYQSISPAPAACSWRARCNALWFANKGLVLVLVSQFFGALMNVTTRLLETSGNPLNTFQVWQRAPKLGNQNRTLT